MRALGRQLTWQHLGLGLVGWVPQRCHRLGLPRSSALPTSAAQVCRVGSYMHVSMGSSCCLSIMVKAMLARLAVLETAHPSAELLHSDKADSQRPAQRPGVEHTVLRRGEGRLPSGPGGREISDRVLNCWGWARSSLA